MGPIKNDRGNIMPPEKSNDSLPIQIAHLNKYIDKLTKLQQDQEGALQLEFELLRQHLAQMNILLDQLIKVNESGSTVAASKKIVPFHTGSQLVGQLLIPPTNPDDYPTRVDIYSINSNRTIPHMTLVNDGPGDIFFINSYSKNVFNEKEGQLHVNDQRELFNVFEIRLRSTLPKTTFRLIEGIFRTGGFAPNTVANTTIKPTIQPNEVLLFLAITFDNQVPTITITVPTVQTFIADYSIPSILLPLPPGATSALIDQATGIPMPFTVPEGFIFESFALFSNMNVDFTVRNYFEFVLGSGVFSLSTVIPIAARGSGTFNAVFNISEFNTQGVDPLGAPPGGRRFLITLTNDDPFNNAIGDFDFFGILRQIT